MTGKKKTKILLVACFQVHNYGSQLQAIASEHILNKYADEVMTANCKNPKGFIIDGKIRYYFRRMLSKYSVQNQIALKVGKVKFFLDKKYRNNICLRKNAFDKYINTHYNLTDRISGPNDLSRISREFDFVVVGSDMLWNPINADQNYYTLNAVPDNIKKISLATSIGTTVIPEGRIDFYKGFMKRFDAISVREQSAVHLVNNLLGRKKAKLVLDPTLQLTAKEWDSITNMDESEPLPTEKYVFAYFLGKSKLHRDIVNQYARKNNMKIVSINHVDGYRKCDINFGDIEEYDCNPDRFVRLIKNAEYIFTDSFHCCAFSLIYEKQFYVFDRFSSSDKTRNNTRIDNLLSQTGLETRRVNSYVEEVDFIDYFIVESRLNKMRRESETFLKGCFLYDR